MSEDFTEFNKDFDGDGDIDAGALYTDENGGTVLVADLDGNGQADFIAADNDADGVFDESYNANTGEYTDLTGAQTEDPSYASEDASTNLDGDVVQSGEVYDYEGQSDVPADYSDASDTSSSGGYYDAAAVSDMMATQHETTMSVINNI